MPMIRFVEQWRSAPNGAVHQTAPQLAQNSAKINGTAPHPTMTTDTALIQRIQSTPTGLTLAELLAQHSTLARRTVQRKIGQWIAAGHIVAQGEGRARRYQAATGRNIAAT